MSQVFVLDTNKQPLAPCDPARARPLLNKGKAALFRRYPFTIILKREVSNVDNNSLRLKIDPGSRTTFSPSSMTTPEKLHLRLNSPIAVNKSSPI